MLTLVVNADKTVTMTLAGRTQIFWDELTASHGLSFIQDFFNGQFTALSKRIIVRDRDMLKREYDALSPADKIRVDDILKGRT
jgi:hypothetical protein